MKVLGWINSLQFAKHCVRLRIENIIPNAIWHYVPDADNHVDRLSQSIISRDVGQWTCMIVQWSAWPIRICKTELMLRDEEFFYYLQRLSEYRRLLKVTAFILRCVKMFKVTLINS